MGPTNFIRIDSYAFKIEEIMYVAPLENSFGRRHESGRYKVRLKSVSVEVPKEVGEALMEFLI